MKVFTAPCVANAEVHALAEGPFWDDIRARLYWVDIDQCRLYRGRFGFGGCLEIEERFAFADRVSAVAVSATGELVVAVGGQLIQVSPTGERSLLVEVVPTQDVTDPKILRRLNDGKPDPAGRLVIGTLRKGQHGPASEVLVRLESDGSLTTIDEDLGLSNGLAWSADGNTLYSVDTHTQTIYVRGYDPQNGAWGARHTFARIEGGSPDGICIDSEGGVWVAVWGAGQVRRYAPDATWVATVEVPAPHVTSVAFAGHDLDILVITTATAELDGDALTQYPDSGRIFTIRPGVRGIRQTLWAGQLQTMEVSA